MCIFKERAAQIARLALVVIAVALVLAILFGSVFLTLFCLNNVYWYSFGTGPASSDPFGLHTKLQMIPPDALDINSLAKGDSFPIAKSLSASNEDFDHLVHGHSQCKVDQVRVKSFLFFMLRCQLQTQPVCEF